MALLWTDGTWTTESAVGNPVLEAPIPGVSTAYILRQPFMVLLASYSAPAANTAHGTYTDFVFVSDSPREDLGGGVCKFTRTYAKVPAQHSEWETYSYNFIGFYGLYGINQTDVTGRERFSRVVLSQVVHDYYLIASGQTYTTVAALYAASGTAQKYYVGNVDTPTDWLSDSPPFVTASTPTRTAYEAMVADAVSNKWSATTGKIIAEDPRITRWMGNIYLRQTRYVLAE